MPAKTRSVEETPKAAPRRGRPPLRDAARTRERILKTATAEFTEKGYDGARVDEIVRRAKISKNLVYHYFDSKEQLFIEVMEGMYRVMRERQAEQSFAGLSPEEGMRKLVTFTFEVFLEQPEVIALLNIENLHKARHIRRSKNIPALYNPLIEAIEDLLHRGQAAGVFRDGVDPVDLYISISGLGYFYLANRHTLGTVFKTDLEAPARIAQRLQHMNEVILGYLRR
jgi:TetR/AcrR family transcriptional regulator